MNKYYIHDGSQEVGPFSVDELLLKGINNDTPIWYDGMYRPEKSLHVKRVTYGKT